jgi:hypothetical protein
VRARMFSPLIGRHNRIRSEQDNFGHVTSSGIGVNLLGSPKGWVSGSGFQSPERRMMDARDIAKCTPSGTRPLGAQLREGRGPAQAASFHMYRW